MIAQRVAQRVGLRIAQRSLSESECVSVLPLPLPLPRKSSLPRGAEAGRSLTGEARAWGLFLPGWEALR